MAYKLQEELPIERYIDPQPNGTFKYVRRIPADVEDKLGGKKFRKLTIKDIDGKSFRKRCDALTIAAIALNEQWKRDVQQARTGVTITNLDKPRIELLHSEFMRFYNFSKSLGTIKAKSMLKADPTGNTLLFEYQKTKTEDQKAFANFMEANGYRLPSDGQFRGEFFNAYHDAIWNEYKDAINAKDMANIASRDTLEAFEARVFKETDQPTKKPMMLFSEMAKECFEALTDLDDEEIARHYLAVRMFTDCVGDHPANYITKKQCGSFVQMLARYPVVKKPEHRAMSFNDLIALADENPEDFKLIKTRTAKAQFGRVNRVFKYAVDNYDDDFDIKNPLQHLTEKVKGGEATIRTKFSDKQIATLFTSEIFQPTNQKRDHKYWLPLIGQFLGIRLSEAANKTVDVIQQDDEGLWFFKVKVGKTKNAIRVIPIPDFLLRNGLIKYRQEVIDAGHTWLFPDFTRSGKTIQGEHRPSKAPSAQFSQWFGRKLEDLNIVAEEGYMIGYHSFRHGWISAATDALIAKELRIKLVGHSAGKEDTHDGYTHNDLVAVKDQMDKIVFKGFPYSQFA